MAIVQKAIHKGMLFTRVKHLNLNKEGTVENALSEQFTVNFDDGTFDFLFYKDQGVTWEALDAQKNTRADYAGYFQSKRAGKTFDPSVWHKYYDEVFAVKTDEVLTLYKALEEGEV